MSDFEDDDDVNLPEEVDEEEDFDANAANGGGPNAAKRARLKWGAESPAGAKPEEGLAAVPVAPPPLPPEATMSTQEAATMSTQELMSKVCTLLPPRSSSFLPPPSFPACWAACRVCARECDDWRGLTPARSRLRASRASSTTPMGSSGWCRSAPGRRSSGSWWPKSVPKNR
jgi:hypothetical protein